MAEPALLIENLRKSFDAPGGRRVHAVNGVSLAVPGGSFYGLLGPNGAGKTTTLSMVTGLLRPDAGRVTVRGHDGGGLDVWSDPVAAKAAMGVLPDGVQLFDRLTGRELVTYNGLLRGLDRDLVASRVDQLLTALDLTGAESTMVVDYSAGMTKKIALACALIHAPKLLILDEPFEAVDPVSATTIRAILHTVVDGGGTVVLSSHTMELVERLCDHVAIVQQGRVVAAGTLDDVRAGVSLEERFVALAGGRATEVDLSWLRSS